MKIVQGLKKLRVIEKRMAKGIEEIQVLSSALSNEKPVMGNEEKQETEVKSLVQSNFDLVEEYLRLKLALEKTNLEVSTSISGEARTLSEWLVIRRKLGSTMLSTVGAMNDRAAENRRTLNRGLTPEGQAVHVVRFYDEKTKNYEAVIKAPDQSGKYRLTTRIIYTDNTYEQSAKVVLVRPYGYVYTEKYQSWSWQKPWQIFFKEKTRVKGAQVALYVLNQKKEWVLWQADSYKQKNPQASGENGEYVFVVPPGKYFLTVKSEGLIRYESGEFKVSENSVVNSPVAMRALFPWRVLVVSLLIFAVVFYAGKKTFFNKDKV